ncbi:PSME3-interacting protein [Sporobolomyces koalae]|uniref:PSME3-interacting protein n=1 Tax=Sporobolomyces koalae TaxID=500713 RepID=UPI003174236C
MAASGGTSTSSVASRFVSSTELEQAAARRAEEWKQAYARIGEEPPKPQEDEVYDGRSLWEKLQENKSKKQEAFEEQLKFKNHFRALDEEEISFLDSMIDENNDEEQERQRLIKQELESFRKAVTARSVPVPPPTVPSPSSTSSSNLNSATRGTSSANSQSTKTGKPTTTDTPSTTSPNPTSTTTTSSSKPKSGKRLKTLPGLVVTKKKSKPSSSTTTTRSIPTTTTTTVGTEDSKKRSGSQEDQGVDSADRKGHSGEDDNPKKRKID